jgi:uncharacterized membrane protein
MAKLMAITRDLPFHLENKVKFTDLTAAINQPLYQSNLVHTDFPPSAVYSPLPYLVAASGILVGKALGASPLIIFLPRTRLQFVGVELHRLQNAAIDPGVQMDVFSAFLSPMSINQAISYSADSLTNALSFFALGYCLYLTFPADNVNLKKLLPLFALAILLPLTKPPLCSLDRPSFINPGT